MRTRRFEWKGAAPTAWEMRTWVREQVQKGDIDIREAVEKIEGEVRRGGDAALLELTGRFDATDQMPASLRVDAVEIEAALGSLAPELREAMEVAAANIRIFAEAQVSNEAQVVSLPQGQSVSVREVPVRAAGIYAPGGRASYPSSVLMGAIPAQVAGVERVALVSPPGPDGHLSQSILAAAALCGIDEVYAVGGAQAIFGLALGTETIPLVDVIVGPGSLWVQEAKRRMIGIVGIDSFAGPSELMIVAGHDTNPEWAALDLCAQAEHGPDSPLVAVAVEEHVLEAIEVAALAAAGSRPSVTDAYLVGVQVPDVDAAIDLANAYAPEHLELLEEDAALLADRVTTAGCVFVGRHGATAFGDYVAGSNHVLPTSGSGRFSGPLGPGTFRRRISNVELTPDAAAALAPQADALARAEGFPVHGESAMIRR